MINFHQNINNYPIKGQSQFKTELVNFDIAMMSTTTITTITP